MAVMTDATTETPPPPTEAVTQPADPTPNRRWFTPLLAGELEAMWPAIVAAFVGVLVIAFAMSYHGLFTFGERIMGWAWGLCAVAPIGLDVFSIVGLLATFLTHDAPWRVRLYCWLAFGLTVLLSVGGNAISAFWVLDRVADVSHERFVWGYQQVSAVAGAAVWPALSAVALHVLIVVRRHLDRRRDKIKKLSQRVRIEEDEAAREEAAEKLLQARAVLLAAEGATAAAIVADLQLPESKQRTYERLTKPIRDALATPKPAVAAVRATSRRTTSVRTE
jgi:hypothetical protein